MIAGSVAASTLPARYLRRQRLDDLLAAAGSVRLTTVTAPAGYGKTTLLAEWASRTTSAWHTFSAEERELRSALGGVVGALRATVPALDFTLPAATGDTDTGGEAGQAARVHTIAGLVCDALSAAYPYELLLVLDDVHLIEPAHPAARLIEALCRQLPSNVHVVLASREPPPFPVQRLRGGGDLVEVTAAQLAFTEDDTTALLADRLGTASASLVRLVHQATGGWPVAVRLAAEALRTGSSMDPQSTLNTLQQPGPLFDYLAREIFDREPWATRDLIRTAALFDRFSPQLLDALGHPGADAVLAELAQRGVFVEPLRAAPGWFGLMPLARKFTASRFGMDGWERHEVHEVAAAWFVEHDRVAEATAALAALEDYPRIEQLLTNRGADLLASEGADAVIDAVQRLPVDRRGPQIWQLAGEAHQVRGDWGQALDCLQRAAGPGGGALTPALARQMAWMHHLSGAPAEALAVCRRCELDGSDPRSESLLLSCMASALWAHGDLDASRTTVQAAVRLAEQCGDDMALGAAHTVLAMLGAATGERTAVAAHYGRALAHAERAGDVLGIIRIRVNRSSHLVEEGDYTGALAELEVGLPLADLTGFATYRALGLNNRGEARLGLGQLDEAVADFRAARDICARTGSWLGALALGHIGEVHSLRGDRALARASFEEAIRLAEVNNTVPQLVPALAGLARLLVADEPETAAELVRRALDCGTGFGYPAALLAATTVALGRGDRTDALDLGGKAEQVARERGDRATLAESLELQARVYGSDPGPDAPRDPQYADPLSAAGRALGLLDQAVTLWREIGNPLGEIRVATARARILGTADSAELAATAEQTARRLGARGLAAEAAAVAEECIRSGRPAVTVQTLGGFRVMHHGEPVPATAWQSRKARDLVKILIARRGRPVTREELIATLWPDEAPEKASNRLSVALSTARSVLEPQRRSGAGQCVIAEGEAVRLDPEAVVVDVLRFLADAQAGLTAWRLQQAEAVPLLAAAEAAYSGDFLEEDPYADWATSVREEARLTYLQVAAALAEHASAAGEYVTASRYCLRILERDCYDEAAHLALVRALVASGSHGEARRRYRTYAVRMDEIGVEPFPEPWAAPARSPGRPT